MTSSGRIWPDKQAMKRIVRLASEISLLRVVENTGGSVNQMSTASAAKTARAWKMARVPDGAGLFCAPISVDMVVIWRYHSLFRLIGFGSVRMKTVSKE
jgi:hypothetical protein